MTCSDYEPLLSAYLHRELRADEAHEVARHLKTCVACESEFHELVDVLKQLRCVAMPQAPAGLLAEVEAKTLLPIPSSRSTPFRWQAWLPVLAMAGIAALILLRLHWTSKTGLVPETTIVKHRSGIPIRHEAMAHDPVRDEGTP